MPDTTRSALNVLSVWLQDCPRGADFAAAHLESLVAHVTSCPHVTSRQVRFRMIVRDSRPEWEAALSEASTLVDARRAAVELYSVEDLGRECDTAWPAARRPTIRRLLKLAEFHCAHPAVHPNYAAASDVLRVVGLARWGGIYLDADRAYPDRIGAPAASCPGCALGEADRLPERRLGIATVELETEALASSLAAGPPFFSNHDTQEMLRTVMQYQEHRWFETTWRQDGRPGFMIVPNNNLLMLSSVQRPETGHPVGLFLLERLEQSVRRFFEREIEARVEYLRKTDSEGSGPLVGPRLSAVICPSGQFYSEAFLHGPAFHMGLVGNWFSGRELGPIEAVRGVHWNVQPGRGANPRRGPASPERPLRRVLPAYRYCGEHCVALPDAVYPYGWINQHGLPVAADFLALVELMEETTGLQRFAQDSERAAFCKEMAELVAGYSDMGGAP